MRFTAMGAGIVVLLTAMVVPWALTYATVSGQVATTAEAVRALAVDELEAEQLRQAIIKSTIENRASTRLLANIPALATFVTALVAVAGVFVTMWKQMAESASQRELDRQARASEARAAEAERVRRVDERFAGTIEHLASGSDAVQAASIVSLMTFSRPEYEALHEQVFLLLLANLKLDHPEAIARLVVEAFEMAARAHLGAQGREQSRGVNLARARASRIDLSGLDLRESDIAFADLRGADLSRSNMWRCRGKKVVLERARLASANLAEARFQGALGTGAIFRNANLVAADLKDADLRGASFFEARLQSAHFERADLRDARFEQSNLNDTFMTDAKLNEATLASLVKAKNWRKAHLDDHVRVDLERRSQGASA